MARDGEGAYWLQESDDLLNPYFGSSMLYCGSVKETYRASPSEQR
jgi:Cu(I)/Ag(I) efflux system membrane fusion protein